MTAITRETLIAELASLSPNARGRRKLEELLARLTHAALIAEVGKKPRLRVKAKTCPCEAKKSAFSA